VEKVRKIDQYMMKL